MLRKLIEHLKRDSMSIFMIVNTYQIPTMLPSKHGKKSSGVSKYFSVKPHCVNDVKIQPLEHIRKPPHLASTNIIQENV